MRFPETFTVEQKQLFYTQRLKAMSKELNKALKGGFKALVIKIEAEMIICGTELMKLNK